MRWFQTTYTARFNARHRLALAIEGRDLSGPRDNTDASSPAFLRVRSILDRSRRINGLAEENEIYILRPVA